MFSCGQLRGKAIIQHRFNSVPWWFSTESDEDTVVADLILVGQVIDIFGISPLTERHWL
jgi:hypothetical protein